jgi:ABC-2 type transport system permease protein
MNWFGLYTLWKKEVWRFLKVTVQTVLTPVITALLYLMIFAQVLEGYLEPYPGVPYSAFLIPGLVMMSLIQNAFANSSSSLIQAKVNGNLVFLLLSPISPLELYLAFTAAAVLRGLLVGIGVWLAALWLVDLPLSSLAWVATFAVLGGALLGAIGVIAGIWAEKYEHMAAFQNFIIMPLTFLSGVFYSIHTLPPLWAEISVFNPFFYMIDGFRHGFLGVSDVSPWLSLAITAAFFAAVSGLCLWLLHTGYKLRH